MSDGVVVRTLYRALLRSARSPLRLRLPVHLGPVQWLAPPGTPQHAYVDDVSACVPDRTPHPTPTGARSHARNARAAATTRVPGRPLRSPASSTHASVRAAQTHTALRSATHAGAARKSSFPSHAPGCGRAQELFPWLASASLEAASKSELTPDEVRAIVRDEFRRTDLDAPLAADGYAEPPPPPEEEEDLCGKPHGGALDRGLYAMRVLGEQAGMAAASSCTVSRPVDGVGVRIEASSAANSHSALYSHRVAARPTHTVHSSSAANSHSAL